MYHLKNFSVVSKKVNPLHSFNRNSSSKSGIRVTVCGAGGRVGRPLCLLLKESPLINELVLYDCINTNTFAEELNRIDTKCRVVSFRRSCTPEALKDSKIIVIVASAPMDNAYEDAFKPNSSIVCQLAKDISLHSPSAFVAIATNPVNSMVPLVSEIFKKKCVYNPNTIFGVTMLDTVRAKAFIGDVKGIDPESVIVPVVGGNSPSTIVPVLSQTKPCTEFSDEEILELTKAIRLASINLAKVNGNQSSSLAAAFAIARFVISLTKGLHGEKDIVEPAYVKADVCPSISYLSTPVQIGPKGIQKNFGVPQLSSYERCEFDNAIRLLRADIQRGEEYVGVYKPKPCNPCNPEQTEKCPDPCKKQK